MIQEVFTTLCFATTRLGFDKVPSYVQQSAARATNSVGRANMKQCKVTKSVLNPIDIHRRKNVRYPSRAVDDL